MKIRYKAIVAYNGKNYHGWAKQPNVITIQEVIEKSFFLITKQKVKIYAAGRTDAGVNATNQVFHFDLKNIDIKTSNLLRAINNILPDEIKIIKLHKIRNNFHARFDAKYKTYEYKINTNKEFDPIRSSFIYQYNKKINLNLLKQCSYFFIGKKNFLSFSTDQRTHEQSVIKKIIKIDIRKKDDLIIIKFTGNSFLRNQIRMIVGTMIAYSCKKINKQKILLLFENPKKGSAIFKAPPFGLTLTNIKY